ncbi:MAG: hypothetical protein ACREQR_03275 [Candidatus Binataceae bacterium]
MNDIAMSEGATGSISAACRAWSGWSQGNTVAGAAQHRVGHSAAAATAAKIKGLFVCWYMRFMALSPKRVTLRAFEALVDLNR